ncbi:hypothetical protein ACFLYJ_00395 [Candidatus Cloacimonadota bacterium]
MARRKPIQDGYVRTLVIGVTISFSPLWYALVCYFLSIFTDFSHGFSGPIGIPYFKEIITILGFIGIAVGYHLRKIQNHKLEEIFDYTKRTANLTVYMIIQMTITHLLAILALVYCLLCGDLIYTLILFAIDFIAMLGLIPSKKLFEM